MEKHNTMPEVTSFLNVVRTGISVGKTDPVYTATCLREGFVDRDSDIDKRMTKKVPSAQDGNLIYYEMTVDGHSLIEIAQELVSLKGTQDEALMAQALIRQGKTISLKQVGDLHKRFVAGETEIGFSITNHNFFFVCGKNDTVLVLCVVLSDGWCVGICELVPSFNFLREGRVFSLEPKKDAQ